MHSFTLLLPFILPALYANIVLAVPLDSREEGTGNRYSGAGGNAPGGNVDGAGGLISILSYNAGDGGDAKSGNARSGGAGRSRQDEHGSNNAYSGAGGNAPGGSVGGGPGASHGTLLSILSGNAGDGGNAGSGSAGEDCDCE